MSTTIFALLVGINEYEGGVSNLHGCVPDVKHMHEFLEGRAQGGDFVLNARVLTSGDPDNPSEIKPTKQAVIAGFRQHLCNAGENDIALFYYSGHGSQEVAPELFWPGEPDHLNETLVCADSRLPGHYDLADKELGWLIQEVASQDAKGTPKAGSPHIVVILDACHSGSGTREVDDTLTRLAPTDQRLRPLDTYIFKPEATKEATEGGNSDWFVPPKGNHILLSACRPDETAKERPLGTNKESRGVFTYCLLETLKGSRSDLTYYDLSTRVASQVRNTANLQTPQIETSEAEAQFTTFLKGTQRSRPGYFQVNWSDNDNSWILAAGALHGIQGPVGSETTKLALFPFEQNGNGADAEANPFIGRAIGDAVGLASVTLAGASQSQVRLEELKEPEDTTRAYLAVVVSQPLPLVQVFLKGKSARINLVREELKRGDLGDDIPLVVQETKDPAQAKLRVASVRAKDKTYQYQITLASDPYSRTVTASDARTAVTRLAHVARWLLLSELENKTSQFPDNAVQIELYRVETKDGKDEDIPANRNELFLTYTTRNGKPQPPRFKLGVRNNTGRELHCVVLDLPETFGIWPILIAGKDSAVLAPKGQPGDLAWLTRRDGVTTAVPSSIPEKLHAQNVDRLADLKKIIISTEEMPPALLQQDDIDTVILRDATRSVDAPKSTLGRLMNRVQSRHAGSEEEEDSISDWKTYNVHLTTHWPLDMVTVPEEGSPARVTDDLSVQGHPTLKGKAQLRLKPFGAGSRDPEIPAVPPVLRGTPENILPLEFTASRNAEPGDSAIELQLDNAEDYTQVTPESPLILNLAQPLGEDETVLMVSYDAESGFYLPVGLGYPKDRETEIRIRSLPKPKTTGERDLKGAVLMLAYKLVPEKVAAAVGFENPYPLLRVATVGEDGLTRYEERGEAYVREQVQKAERILLLIHGLTGDTRGMVASTRSLKEIAPDLESYDLILTFDYENINTRIQDTAFKLRERLERVGLEAGHSKVLHIVAHSLGTQVSRWFVEREGGNQIASKLVMMGPPNAGTPLAVLEEWAIYMIGLALNGLLYVVNPASALLQLARFASTAVAGIEKIDTTMDQIKPNSEFYQDLARSQDPKFPYHIVMGSTRQINYAPLSPKQATNAFSRAAAQLFSPRMVHRVLSVAFADQPNDMALSVESAESITFLKPERNPKPTIVVVDCDHINYFNSDVGLKALAAALKA